MFGIYFWFGFMIDNIFWVYRKGSKDYICIENWYKLVLYYSFWEKVL